MAARRKRRTALGAAPDAQVFSLFAAAVAVTVSCLTKRPRQSGDLSWVSFFWETTLILTFSSKTWSLKKVPGSPRGPSGSHCCSSGWILVGNWDQAVKHGRKKGTRKDPFAVSKVAREPGSCDDIHLRWEGGRGAGTEDTVLTRSSDTRPLRLAVGRALVSLNQTKNEVDGKKKVRPQRETVQSVRMVSTNSSTLCTCLRQGAEAGPPVGGQVGASTVGGWWWRLAPRRPSFLGLRWEADLRNSQRAVVRRREKSTGFLLGKLSLRPC